MDAGDIAVPDATVGSPFVVREAIGEFPHGIRLRAKQDDVPVLLTILDPVLAADVGARATVVRTLRQAQGLSHRNLLPVYGFSTTSAGFLIVEADPGGTTVRKFARHRASRGKALDAETVFTLVGHLCNALGNMHERFVHGYVTADTVLVSSSGRVHLSSAGYGDVLPRVRNFRKFREAGLLPNVAPEQLLSPPQLTPGTDILGVATLFLELLTGLPLLEAGQPIQDLGLRGPEDLLMCLERATAPSASARPPDMTSFKVELAEAVRSGRLERGEPRAPTRAPPPTPTEDQEITFEGIDLGAAPPSPDADRPPPAAPRAPSGSQGRAPSVPQGRSLSTPARVAAPRPPAGPPPAHPPRNPPPPARPPAAPPARHPPAAPPPASPKSGDSAEALAIMDELDRLDAATKRITDLDDDAAIRMTQLVDGAEPELEMIVTDDQHDAPKAPPPTAGSSSSMLGLRVDNFEDVAARLSTLDGERGMDGVDARAKAVGPSQSGTFFGSFDPEVDQKIADRHGKRGTAPPRPRSTPVSADAPEQVESSDQRPLFFLVRGGEMIGPISPHDLYNRGREGELDLRDLLCHRSTGEEFEVGQLEMLRNALTDHADREQLRKFAQAAVRAKPLPTAGRLREPPRPGSKRWVWTLLLVVVVLGGFAAAGWTLMQRGG